MEVMERKVSSWTSKFLNEATKSAVVSYTGEGQVYRRNDEFHFAHDKLDRVIIHPRRDAKQTVGYMRLEFRGQV